MAIEPIWVKLEWSAAQNQASVDQHVQEAQRERHKEEKEAQTPS